MSDDGDAHDGADGDAQDSGDGEAHEGDDQLREFHVEVGLRPLSGLLNSLFEFGVRSGSVPTGDRADRSTIDERLEDRRRGDAPDEERSPGAGAAADDEHLVDTRHEGDEFVVTADIPGASRDDLTVGIDPRTNELVVKRDGDELDRVAMPWESVDPERVIFNNGVLEARFRPAHT